MRRSSARSGQIEPFAALAAVAVVALALGVYAGVFAESVPKPVDRNVAEPTVDRVERALTVGGVVRPTRMATVDESRPEGYLLNVTLDSGENATAVGPAPPETADRASRRVSVRGGPGNVSPGRLEVHVWT